MHKYTSKKMYVFPEIREIGADLEEVKFTGKKMILTMAAGLPWLTVA
jgi:hypothetical protein